MYSQSLRSSAAARRCNFNSSGSDSHTLTHSVFFSSDIYLRSCRRERLACRRIAAPKAKFFRAAGEITLEFCDVAGVTSTQGRGVARQGVGVGTRDHAAASGASRPALFPSQP